jgi:hypothetical protein
MKLQICILLTAILCIGCSSEQSHSIRRSGAPMVTQISDLHGAIGKRVTVVGTARRVGSRDSTIEIKSGYVDLPGYEWPKNFIDQRVQVIGTIVEKAEDSDMRGKPVYRLGEIQSVSRWSR